jgi:hypothetical protein
MNRISFTFFLGSLVPAAAILLLGGSSAACLFAGMLVLLIPALLFARMVAGWLYWLADAVDAVRGLSGRRAMVVAGEIPERSWSHETARRPTRINRKPPTPAPSEDESHAGGQDKEIVSALVNLGMPRKQAQTAAAQTTGSFAERIARATRMRIA